MIIHVHRNRRFDLQEGENRLVVDSNPFVRHNPVGINQFVDHLSLSVEYQRKTNNLYNIVNTLQNR